MKNNSRRLWSLLSLVMILSMVLSPLVVSARDVGETRTVESPVPAVERGAPAIQQLKEKELAEESEIATIDVLDKIDPLLREAALAGGKEKLMVSVSVVGDATVEPYMDQVIRRPIIFGGIRSIYGFTTASELLNIASLPTVAAVIGIFDEPVNAPVAEADAPTPEELRARMDELVANEVTYAEAAQIAAGGVGAEGWYDVREGHKSAEAWKKGFTGQGVIAGVIDDGVDFGHPDLQGTTARVTDPTSPYYGWPMAFSHLSALYFAYDIYFGTNYILSGATGSRWVDTRTTVERSSSFDADQPVTAMFQPLDSGVAYEYTLPGTSRSGFYKLGSHPDRDLLALYGHRVAVLVVDEAVAGRYDTVYVDLDNDKDFTDEKPATKWSPEVYRDMDGDGYADISGGQIVWISDGANVPPTTDWLWAIGCADVAANMRGCPNRGNLVLFAGAFDSGYSHGTNVASNIGGQGVVNGGLSDQSFRVGGMVQGAAPEVGIMDFGNYYYGINSEDTYLVAALGYDGIPQSGDEIQLTNNSYGSFGQMWGSFGYTGRFIAAMNMTIAPSTLFVFSAGNEGPGYGPQEGDGGLTTLQVGSSTQFGSTNWDSIATYDQVVSGDVTTFYSKGPNRDGGSGVDILANGGRGAGSEKLNYFGFDGWTSWATWGGTSRSAPVAVGNAALVYDAFMARHGRFPTWAEVKALLKSGADDAGGSPFYQGAGVLNADRSTDLAAGIYGVYATPTEWTVGDWMGVDYPAFAHVAWPGETYNTTYTLYNPSQYDIEVALEDGYMQRIGEYDFEFTTAPLSEESPFNFHAPDYLIDMDESEIPAGTELMVVRFRHTYDTFDPDYNFSGPLNSFRYMVYRWDDLNGDGLLWEDFNGNGAVNHVGNGMFDNDGFERPDFNNPLTEIQEGEYIRTDYDFGGAGTAIAVRDPLERMHDGFFFGLQHRASNPRIPQTTVYIQVEFYARADWPWLSLSDSAVTVPAGGEATFVATMTFPEDAEPGAYEGIIFMYDGGDAIHEAHETALPVVANIIADIPDGGGVILGGGGRSDTLYQNGGTYNLWDIYGGGWQGAGDWRHFFLNVDEAELADQNLLVHTSWEGGFPTDFNTFVLGPTEDCASNGVDNPCQSFGFGTIIGDFWPLWWNALDFGLPAPDFFGPYTLWPISGVDQFRSGTAYAFETTTGINDDWRMVALEREGLHEIALHQVLGDNEQFYQDFTVEVGTIGIDATMMYGDATVTPNLIAANAYSESGTIELQFTPTIDIPDLVGSLSGGLETMRSDVMTTTVPDNGQCYNAFCANNVYETIVVDQTNATKLLVHLYMPAAQDADLFLVYDSNGNGTPDQGVDAVVGSSGNASGSDERIVVTNPALGTYFVAFAGYDVDPDSGVDLNWYYEVEFPSGLPTEMIVVEEVTATISQDAKYDPTDASWSYDLTVDDRVRSIHALVDGIPSGNDVDLYITDEDGNIVARAQQLGNAAEHILFQPADNYRFEPGSTYTIWVHGFNVPGAPIQVHVKIWIDQLNIWLGDNVTGPIEAGETATLEVHFEKEGWDVGDPPLSARLVAGPTALQDAFERLIVIERASGPSDPEWDSDNLDFWFTVESELGPSPTSRYTLGGIPIPTALARANDIVTFTVHVENTDPAVPAELIIDVYPLPEDYLNTWFGTPNQTHGVDYGLVSPQDAVAYTFGGYDGIFWQGTVQPGEEFTLTYWVQMPPNMMTGDNFVTGVDVYDGNGAWLGWDLAGAYARAAFANSFTLLKDASDIMVAAGDVVTYSVAIYNASVQTVEMLVWDDLSTNVTYLSGSAGTSYDADLHRVSWNGDAAAGGVVPTIFEYVVQINADVPEGTFIENTAVLYNKLEANVLDSSTVVILVDDGLDPDLSLEKTVDRFVRQAGSALQYTIVIANNGDETAENAMLHDVLPPQLVPITASITGGAVWLTQSDGSIALHWLGDLAPGESKTFTFRATIAPDTPADYALINAATLEADNFMGRLYNSALTEIAATYLKFFPIILR